ncbi:MAG: ATP-binding protein [Planctomycetes bacterium]|nr:ATP-binding protein [Planctomycetota bacterium]
MPRASSSTAHGSAPTANQAWLAARLGRLAVRLQNRLQADDGADSGGAATAAWQTAEAAMLAAQRSLQGEHALERISRCCALSPFETEVLLWTAGVEINNDIADLTARLSGTRVRQPTPALLLAVIPDSHWTAFAPDAPLRRLELVQLEPGPGLPAQPLRVAERVLHALLEVATIDERLLPFVAPVQAADRLPPTLLAAAEVLAATLRHGGIRVALSGAVGSDRRGVAATAASRLGRPLHAIAAADLPVPAAERAALVRLWQREALLTGAVLLLELGDDDPHEALRAGLAVTRAVACPTLLSARELLPPDEGLVRMSVPRPTRAEQTELWAAALGPAARRLDGALTRLTGVFDFGASEIARGAATVRGIDEGQLWRAARELARPRLDALAERIAPKAGWDDLVLPDLQRQVLQGMAAQVRQRVLVHDSWGFAERGSRGLGLSALFVGPSGTGKTLAAEVIARDLQLDLYRVDLSAVVSKYIGETEKNLRRVFDAAEMGGVVLLFDEADALFGKRSEVRDAHDRHANIEVSYLLQRLETFRGIAILTTNKRQAIDEAFVRRIRFIVAFPYPDQRLRAEVWRRAFPAAARTEGLDPERLARLDVAPGNIRQIALNAAFLAAEAGSPITMACILRAAQVEYAKLEKPLTDAEAGGLL